MTTGTLFANNVSGRDPATGAYKTPTYKILAVDGSKMPTKIVLLDCGEEVFVDSCKMFRRLPKGAQYKARLLRRTIKLPEALRENAAGCHVWEET